MSFSLVFVLVHFCKVFVLNALSQRAFLQSQRRAGTTILSLLTELTEPDCILLHNCRKKKKKEKSITTCKIVKGSKGEDWTLKHVRKDHYDSLSGRSKTLFLISLCKWWADTEPFLLSHFDSMLCVFMLSLNLLLFIAQV